MLERRLRREEIGKQMLYPEIRELYKYYPPEVNRIESVINNNLYFADTSSLNDPFDGKVNIVTDNDVNKYVYQYVNDKNIRIEKYKDVNELIQQEMLDKNRKLKKTIKDEYKERAKFWIGLINQTRIASFTSESNNILMWSHYAKNNTGFCVGYKRVGFLSNDRFCFPVNYSDFYPTIHIIDFINNNRGFSTFYGTKSIKWSYEKEWRAISQKKGINEDIKVLPVKIILGVNSPKDIENELTKFAKNKNIAIYKAYCAKNEYKLKFTKI